MKLLKKIAAAALACVLMCSLAACASGGETQTDVTIDVTALADSLHDGLTFQDQLTGLDGDAAMNIYGLDSSSVVQLKVYVSTCLLYTSPSPRD